MQHFRATLTFHRRRTRSKLRSCDASVAASGAIAKAVSALYSEGRKENLIGAQINLQNGIQRKKSVTKEAVILMHHELLEEDVCLLVNSLDNARDEARAAHRMGAFVSSLGCAQDGCFRQLPRLHTGWVLPSAPEAAP
ncbi:hypothetical protein B0H10DRAFT_1966079 [Mycena sp. CBHHK59/15]|nr:hypothetical protein B0H10DRAFT_1966079 [Mycena sp. CBHHK59/15]